MRRQDGSISISVLQTEEQKYAYRGNDIPTSVLSLLSQNRENIALKSKRKIFGETMVFQIARKHKKESVMIKHVIKTKKCKDRIRLYSILFFIGI